MAASAAIAPTLRVGLGGVSEVHAALRLAVAWAFLDEADLLPAFALLTR